jgi:hypothetical protein
LMIIEELDCIRYNCSFSQVKILVVHCKLCAKWVMKNVRDHKINCLLVKWRWIWFQMIDHHWNHSLTSNDIFMFFVEAMLDWTLEIYL